MILAGFLKPLIETGKPVFDSPDPPRDLGKPASRTADLLQEIELRRRLDAPGTPPLFDLKSAHFALGCLCRLAQYTVYREIPEDQIKKEWTALATPLHQFPSSSETI
ncbi:MAG: hypothetical protein CMO55_25965 [Verrucomicrobiales bacterium]|nr:hypothetical protein [Verrucomicrobiales bacterium]